MSSGAERTQRRFQKWHKCTHARTHKVQPSRQATVNLVEKYGNRCIKVQDFEGLQGHSGVKDRPMGNTSQKMKEIKAYWGNGTAQQLTHRLVENKFKEYMCISLSLYANSLIANSIYSLQPVSTDSQKGCTLLLINDLWEELNMLWKTTKQHNNKKKQQQKKT